MAAARENRMRKLLSSLRIWMAASSREFGLPAGGRAVWPAWNRCARNQKMAGYANAAGVSQAGGCPLAMAVIQAAPAAIHEAVSGTTRKNPLVEFFRHMQSKA